MTSQLCCLHRNVYASLNASLKLTLNAKILLTKTAIHKYKQLFGFIRAKINLKKKNTKKKMADWSQNANKTHTFLSS